MFKKILAFLKAEEAIVILTILAALALAFSPFVYELVTVNRGLHESRYPLFEDNFPPDMRVYLSRMRQGAEGKWLVSEKYTSEPHQRSVLHLGYLLMGKAAAFLGVDPVTAFPIWRLIASAFSLGTGYFFLTQVLQKKRQRIAAFLLFVFVGNLPRIAEAGIPLLGLNFSWHLGWYTFFNPAKRLFFHPHYNLAAGFLALTMAFLWRGVQKQSGKDFFWAGLSALVNGLVLPTSLLVNLISAGFLLAAFFFGFLGKPQNRTSYLKPSALILRTWSFWLILGLGFGLLLYSLSYFPWSIHSLADSEKRFKVFNFCEVTTGLGSTGLLGLISALYVLVRRRKAGLMASFWLLSVSLVIAVFNFFPISNSYRPLQIELHLPLAVTSVVFLGDLASFLGQKLKQKQSLFFGFLVFLLLLPSVLTWAMDLRSQRIFVRDKIKAGYPLIPQLPFVVYPVKEAMEAIFWLKEETNHESVVLAAETMGSMVPAYAGNTVYLGHGNQTVYFRQKMEMMRRFYQGRMTPEEEAVFLAENRIGFIVWGPEEQEIASEVQAGAPSGYQKVFQNQFVTIFKIN